MIARTPSWPRTTMATTTTDAVDTSASVVTRPRGTNVTGRTSALNLPPAADVKRDALSEKRSGGAGHGDGGKL